MNDFPWLTVLILVPLVGAAVTAFLPKAPGSVLPKQVALAFSVLTLAVGIAVAAQFDTGDGGILLTVALVPVVFVASWHEADGRNVAAFFAWALALESFALCVFAATDVFLFYVVFEATLIPAYFLIGGFGREGRAYAAL